MKFPRSAPWIAAALIAAAAVALSVHTATYRMNAAQARRQSSDPGTLKALSGQGRNGSERSAARLAAGGSDRQTLVAKRILRVLSNYQNFERSRDLVALMKDFTSDDFRIALEACLSQSSGAPEDDSALLEEWVRLDPEGALAWAAARGGQFKTRMLEKWAERDGESAMRWVRAQPPGEDSRSALLTTIATIGQRNPRRGLELLVDLKPEDRAFPLQMMMRSGSREGVAAVIAWVDALRNPAERVEAAGLILANWNVANGRELFALMASSPELFEKGRAGYGLREWVSSDPDGAIAGLGNFPDGPQHGEVLGQIVPLLFEAGRVDEASEILANYPGEVGDDLRLGCCQYLANFSVEKALEMTSSIRDPYRRDRAGIELFNSWTGEEGGAEAAMRWAASQELTPGIREHADEFIAKRRKGAAAKNNGK